MSHFLITLQSYYFYSIRMAPFPLLGSLWIILSAWRSGLKYFKSFEGALGAIFILSSTFMYFFQPAHFSAKALLGSLLGTVLLFAIQHSPSFRLGRSLEFILWIHLIAWTVQFFAFYGLFTHLDWVVDYLAPLTGESQRTGWLVTDGQRFVNRTAGLYNEPSTYCLFTTVLCWLNLPRVSKEKGALFIALTVLTCFFSWSLFGWIWAAFLLLTAWRSKKFDRRSILVLIFVPLILFLKPNIRWGLFYTTERLPSIIFEHSFRVRTQAPDVQAEPIPAVPVPNQDPRIAAPGNGFFFWSHHFSLVSATLLLLALLFRFKFRFRVMSILFLFLMNAPYIQQPFFWWTLGILAREEKKHV